MGMALLPYVGLWCLKNLLTWHQAGRWIRTDADNKYFTTIDYGKLKFNTNVKPVQVSQDEDFIMLDVGTSESDADYHSVHCVPVEHHVRRRTDIVCTSNTQ